jgi:CpXC protein
MAGNVSLPQYPDTACVRCRSMYKPELYVIVDAEERPDLVQRIKDDIIHCAFCPHCGVVMNFGLPLLVYRRGASVPVIYSPVAVATPQQREDHAMMLLRLLSQQLGPDWDDRLARGVYTAERDQLAEVVDVNPDLLPGGRDPALRQAMDELLWIDTWERAQQVVEGHAAVLLGPEADIVLRRGLSNAQAAGETDNASMMARHLDLLRQCREKGIGAAFAPHISGSGASPKWWWGPT